MDRFAVIDTYYWWLHDHHHGQGSREYARLSKIRGYYKPGMLARGPEAPEAYYSLCKRAGCAHHTYSKLEDCMPKQEIPSDWPVRPLRSDEHPPGRTECGTCGRAWDDDIATSMTPTPSARCPFESFHGEEEGELPMRAIITIDMDGAAFEDDNAGPELARILRVAADAAEAGQFNARSGLDYYYRDGLPLRDINGNRVGEMRIERER